MLKAVGQNFDIEKLRAVSKQAPAAVEVEMAVLGAMILDNESVPKAFEILKPEYFSIKKID